MLRRFLVLLVFICSLQAQAQVSCDVQVLTTGERCAGSGDGTAKVVVNGQTTGRPASCLTADAAPASYAGSCTSTYSSNSGEVLVAPGQQVCLTASNFTGGIQATGGTLVISGNATPAYMNLNGSNPAFTLIILGTAQFSSLNLFGSSTVKNYGTLKVPSVGFNGTLENNGTLIVTGDLNINAPYGTFTNKGSVTVSSNFNNYNTTTNGGTIAVSGTINNNSGGTLTNLCTITAGGDLNNNNKIINQGSITVGAKTAMNGSSLYQGYAGALLTTVNTTVDGIVQGMSSSCSSIKVSGNTIINSSAIFSGAIDYCDATGIETNTGTFNAPASKNCSCSAVSATYAWQSPLTGTSDHLSNLSAGSYSVVVSAQGCTAVTKTFTITAPAVLTASVTPNGLSVSASVTGGTAPYSFSWSGNQSMQATAAYAASGSYTLTVTDSKGCSKSQGFTVTAPTTPPTGSCTVTVQTTNPTCAGSSDGTATIYVNGSVLGTGSTGTGGGTPAGCSVAQTSSYSCTTGCTQTITDNNAGINVASGQQVCLTATAYTGNINVTGGTLVICGKATPQNINYNTNGASFTLIVNGELTLSNLNLPSGCTLKNYGKVTYTSSVSFSGAVYNYGTMIAGGDFNNNASTGSFYNYGTLTVAGNLNCNVTGVNSGTLQITGNLQNNGGGNFTNNCTIVVSNELINNATFTNNGNISVAHWTRLNGGSTMTIGAGMTLSTQSLTLDGTVTGAGSSCSALQVSGQSIVNGSGKLQGNVSMCDATPDGTDTFTGTVVSPATRNCSCILQPIQYSSPLAGMNNPYQGLPAGTYTVTVQTQGCAATTKTFTITDPAAITASVSVSGRTATVSASGGQGSLVYTWSDGSSGSSNSHTYVNDGSYQVTVSDSKNCSKTIGFHIPVPTVADSSCTQLLVEYPSPGQVRITCVCAGITSNNCNIIDGNGNPIGHTIPQTKNDSIVQVNTGPGTTTTGVLIEGSNHPPYVNPTGSGNGTGGTGDPVTNTLAISTTVTPESCAGKKDGSIQLTITGGSGDYSISNNSTTQTSGTTISNVGAGTVLVQVYDNKTGYSKTATVVVGIKATNSYQLVVNSTQPTGEAATVSLQVSGSNPTTNTVAQWSTGATGFGPISIPTWLYATGYISVTVSESWVCPQTYEISVVPNCAATLTPALSSVDATCYGSATGQVSITNLPAGASIVWSGTPSLSTGSSVSSLAAGTYHADVYTTLSNGNKCKAGGANVTVNQPARLQVSVAQNSGTAYTAQVSGGVGPYSYQWSTGVHTAAVSLSGSGFYQVQVTDSKACVQATQLYIPVPPCTSGVNLNITPLSCITATSGSITASSAISGATYYWSGAGITNPYNATQSNLGEGLYVVSVSGWNPQCLSRTGVQLKKPAPLQVSSKQVGNTVSILASNGTPNYKVVWRFDNKQTDIRSDLTPGTSYTVDVTDAKGCTLAYTFTYDPCAANPILASVKMDGTAATPVVSGGAAPYTYLWALETVGGTALSDPTQAVQNSLTGTYHVTITDARACTVTLTITGPNCGLGSLGVTSQAPSCNSRCDASAQISGTLPAGAQITWDNQAVAYSLVDACWGTHTVQIKNAQGCYVEQSFTIAASQSACAGAGTGTGSGGSPDCSTFSVALQAATSVLNKKCASDVANIDVQISGGKPLYHMSWDVQRSGSAVTETFSTDKEDYANALPGSYTLHVIDQQGCSKNLSVTVTGPLTPLISTAVATPATCPEQLASVVFTLSGGTLPYTITDLGGGSGGSTSAQHYTISPAQAGPYSYQLSDASGCIQHLDVTIPALPAVVFGGRIIASQTSLRPGEQAILTPLTVSGYTIRWTAFANPAQLVQRVNAAGTYSVTYSKTGCTSYTPSIVIGVTDNAVNPPVKSILCTSTEPVEITLDTADYCANYKRLSAKAFGQYQYELYVAEQKFNIRQAYQTAVLGQATESLTMNFNDTEQQYTLYYYDQSGNLVRTVPPSGVKVLSDDETTKAVAEVSAGTHNTITTHDYTTTYAYNSLNQLVHQDIPDHQRIDLWQTGSSTAALNGGTVAAVGYGAGNSGIMLSNTTDKAQLLTTTDAGKSWQASQNIGLGKITSISRLAAPSTVVYAGGENGTFLASGNGGRSWSLLPLPTQSAVKKVYFSTELAGWIITADGSLYSTPDGGKTWPTFRIALQSSIGTAQVQDVSVNSTTGIIWVLSTTNRIYQSSDATGASWSEKTIDSPTAAGVSALSSGVGFAGPRGTLFTVSGSSLQVQRTGLDQDVQRILSANSAGSYYALTTAGEVYYGSDLQTWSNTGLSGITSLTKEGSLILAADGSGVYTFSGASHSAKFSFTRVHVYGSNYLTLASGNTISITDNAFTASQTYSTAGGTITGIPGGVTLSDVYPSGGILAALGSDGNVYEGTFVAAVTTPAPVPAHLTFTQKYTGITAFILQGTNLYLKTTGNTINSYASGAQTVQLSAATTDVLLTAGNTGYAVESGKLKAIAAGALSISPLPLTAAPLKALAANGSKVYAAGTDAELYVYSGSGNFAYVPVVANTSTILDAQYAAAQSSVQLLTASDVYTYSEGNPDLAHPASGYSNAVQLSTTATTEILAAASGSPVSGQQQYSVEGSQYPYLSGGDQGKLWYKETAAGSYVPATINVQPLSGLAYATGSNVIAVGKQGTILTSSDAGTSWKMVYSGTESDLTAVSASGNTAVVTGANNTVLYSSNGGLSWNASSTAITAPTGVKVTNSTVLLTAGTKLYKSTNGGQSFTAETLTPVPTATLRSVWLDADGYGFIAGDAGMAYRIKPGTTANTLSYTQIATDADITDDKGTGIPVAALKTVQFNDRLTGYITGTTSATPAQGIVLKTVDGGYHWKPESGGATGSATPILALSSDAQHGTLVGSDGSVQALNDQAEQFNSRFWYDELGRLILSQNAKQFTITAYESPATINAAAAVPNNGGGTMRAYSYTLYDPIGRITEVGEILSGQTPQTAKNESQILFATHTAFVGGAYKHQVSKTYYDRNANPPAGLTPTYLRNRVAYTTYQQEPNAPVQQTHYSYDVHGNVNSLVQVISKDGQTLAKRVDYDYDLISGKVNNVYYQKGQSDQLIHTYSYDGDNRITQVQTSTDGVMYTKEASYDYYAHGPLARTTIGELTVETENYAYTIQGWIKQMQAAAFSYALGYNENDYTAIGSGASVLATPIQVVNGKSKGLYNGNIATMSSNTPVVGAANWQQQYSYDQLNRITASVTPGGAKTYSTGYSYDANGNIKALGRYDNTGTQFDTLTYNYETKANGYEHTTNKLRWVDDLAGSALSSTDIDDQGTDNYSYDAIGNLIKDKQEEIDSIQWTVSGKVHKVIRTATSSKPNLEFEYDASGQRTVKKVIRKDGSIAATYYLRDASGNVMSVYEYNSVSDNAPNLAEQYLYGSSRIGVATPGAGTSTGTQGTVLGSRAFGLKSYELTDHLGNVRTTLSDYRRLAAGIVNSASDYYPFGMVVANRQYTSASIYRYGFNGQEQDSDIGVGIYTAEFWQYDSRLGRRWNVDPLATPWESTYSVFHNNPIMFVDPLGLSGEDPAQGTYKNGNQTLVYKNGVAHDEKGNQLDKDPSQISHATLEAMGWVKQQVQPPTMTPRKDWNAAEPNNKSSFTTVQPKSFYHYIAIHHAGNDDSPTMGDVQEEHLDQNFNDVGYHFGIDLQGNIYEGRPLWKQGATVGPTADAKGVIAIVILGDMQNEGFWEWSNDHLTPEALNSLTKLVNYLTIEYNIVNVGGHMEINCNHTQCPGNQVMQHMDAIRLKSYTVQPACLTTDN